MRKLWNGGGRGLQYGGRLAEGVGVGRHRGPPVHDAPDVPGAEPAAPTVHEDRGRRALLGLGCRRGDDLRAPGLELAALLSAVFLD